MAARPSTTARPPAGALQWVRSSQVASGVAWTGAVISVLAGGPDWVMQGFATTAVLSAAVWITVTTFADADDDRR